MPDISHQNKTYTNTWLRYLIKIKKYQEIPTSSVSLYCNFKDEEVPSASISQIFALYRTQQFRKPFRVYGPTDCMARIKKPITLLANSSI